MSITTQKLKTNLQEATPHQGQISFHKARLRQRWRGLFGGTGSGKTYAGVLEDIYWAINYPGVEGAVFEPTYGMIKRNVVPILDSVLGHPFQDSPYIENYNRGDMLITWRQGRAPDNTLKQSKTWLSSLDDPEKAEGQSLDYAHIDEARLVRHMDTGFKVIQRRLRGSATTRGLGYPIGAWVTTTPDDPGSTLHQFFEDPITRNPESRIYRMTLFDNRANLPTGYINEVVRAHVGGEYDRFVLGLFATVEAGILGFDYSMHVIHDFQTAEGIVYVNEQDEPIQHHNSIKVYSYGHDFGWTNPAAQIVIGWDGDGRVYVLDEYYKQLSPEEELIESARELETIYMPGDWWCDASEPRTIDKLLTAGLTARPYKGKREDGIRELGSRFRLQGDMRYRLYIHKRCVNLISELQTYDPEQKTRDHAVDALRYGIMGGIPPIGDIQVGSAKRPW